MIFFIGCQNKTIQQLNITILVLRKFLYSLFVLLVLGGFAAARAQGVHRVYFKPDEVADVSDSVHGDSVIAPIERLHGSIGLGTGVISGWGHTLGYTYFNPELTYRVSDRLKLGFGMGIAKGFDYGEMHIRNDERSLAPRKHKRANYMHLDGVFAVNDRLTVAAAVFMMHGNMHPWMCDVPAGYAVGASAAMRYRFGNDNYMSLYMEYIHSENMPLMPYYYGYGAWGGFYDYGVMGHTHLRFFGD